MNPNDIREYSMLVAEATIARIEAHARIGKDPDTLAQDEERFIQCLRYESSLQQARDRAVHAFALKLEGYSREPRPHEASAHAKSNVLTMPTSKEVEMGVDAWALLPEAGDFFGKRVSITIAEVNE